MASRIVLVSLVLATAALPAWAQYLSKDMVIEAVKEAEWLTPCPDNAPRDENRLCPCPDGHVMTESGVCWAVVTIIPLKSSDPPKPPPPVRPRPGDITLLYQVIENQRAILQRLDKLENLEQRLAKLEADLHTHAMGCQWISVDDTYARGDGPKCPEGTSRIEGDGINLIGIIRRDGTVHYRGGIKCCHLTHHQ